MAVAALVLGLVWGYGIGSILAILFLSERPQPFHGIGYALVVTGVVLAARK